MKPKNNRIIAARFKAQRLMQEIITEGVYTPRGQSMLHKLWLALIAGKASLASMGMIGCRQDRLDHRKAVRATRAEQVRFTG